MQKFKLTPSHKKSSEHHLYFLTANDYVFFNTYKYCTLEIFCSV